VRPTVSLPLGGPNLVEADRIEVSANQVHGNTDLGIYAHYNVLVTGNEVYGHVEIGRASCRERV